MNKKLAVALNHIGAYYRFIDDLKELTAKANDGIEPMSAKEEFKQSLIHTLHHAKACFDSGIDEVVQSVEVETY